MKNILISSLVLFAITSFSFAQTELTSKLPKTSDPAALQEADKQLKLQNKEIVKLVVIEVSKKLPLKIDDYTQFVSIKADDLKLISTYEINTAPKSDESVIREDKPRMEEFVKKGICESSKRFLQSDIEIVYIYANSLSKKELFSFHVKAKDCINIWQGIN